MHELSSGRQLYQLPLGFGQLTNVKCDARSAEFMLEFESYLRPTVIWHGDFSKCSSIGEPVQLDVFYQRKIPPGSGIELNKFVEKQVFYRSKDGTKVLLK